MSSTNSQCQVEWISVSDAILSAASVVETVFTVSECLRLCTSLTEMVCLSVAYSFSTKQCLLYSVNQFANDSLLVSKPGWDYYERHCC